MVKIGPVDTEIALLKFKKKKKLRTVKYIAQSAGLPSGLKILKTIQYHKKTVRYSYREAKEHRWRELETASW